MADAIDAATSTLPSDRPADAASLLARWAGENQARHSFEDVAIVAAAGLAPLVDADPSTADGTRLADLSRQVDASGRPRLSARPAGRTTS